jgi:hypothetical protein
MKERKRKHRIVREKELEGITHCKENWEEWGPFGKTHIICPCSLPWVYLLSICTFFGLITPV